jgi:hypothetical protein
LWQIHVQLRQRPALRLEMAKLLMTGHLPYRDFIDADPPTMMLLSHYTGLYRRNLQL